jgi:hypothetical protein
VIAAPTFGEAAPELELRGFEPIPIRPDSKAPAADRWQCGGPVAAWLPRHARCGIGLLTRGTPAADDDVRRPEAAEAVDRLAVVRLGDGPLRIGQAPKRSRLYRTEVPFPKIAGRELALPGDEPGDKPHKVEMLAEGQQLACFGVHPDTRLPYTWPDTSPLDLERQDLPPITAEAAARFVAEAEELLVRRFRARPKEGAARVRRPAGDWLPGPAPRGAADPAEAWFVLEALANLPNRDLDYDTWVSVAYALKAALGEAGRRPFDAWSRQSGKYGAAATAQAWRHVRPDRAGWRFLIEVAGGDPARVARSAAALRRAISRVGSAPGRTVTGRCTTRPAPSAGSSPPGTSRPSWPSWAWRRRPRRPASPRPGRSRRSARPPGRGGPAWPALTPTRRRSSAGSATTPGRAGPATAPARLGRPSRRPGASPTRRCSRRAARRPPTSPSPRSARGRGGCAPRPRWPAPRSTTWPARSCARPGP